jgi:hypothetical protein
MWEHVFGNSCRGDIHSKVEQFAMNSSRFPEGIIFAYDADEVTNIFINPQSARPTTPAFPVPR